MTTLAELQKLASQGESEILEFKRSTGELKRVGETLCAFLNADGGSLLIGLSPDGQLLGQQVSDQTRREIAAMLTRFEPSARVEVSYLDLGSGLLIILLVATPSRQFAPFVYDARPYKRVGTTTRVMTQEEYSRMLLDRNHSRFRWENQVAEGVRLEDLDREEILQTRATAIAQRRLSAGTSMDIGDILDRLGLRIDGQILNAAQILYGTKFLPYYPQGVLKLGRFRGTKITGDILDNKLDYMHAFAMVREAVAWLDRTLPLSARFPKGVINREDRLPVPMDALREIIINAVIHRDVSHPSSYVAIAVFDDRIEVRSIGGFPTGIRAEMLKTKHSSVLVNPLIAGTFHRTGAIEEWGQGTNRVVDACVTYGIPEPIFEDVSGGVWVTFKAPIVADLGHAPYQAGPQSVVSRDQGGTRKGESSGQGRDQAMTSSGASRDQVGTTSGLGRDQVGTKLGLSSDQFQLLEVAVETKTMPELMTVFGRKNRSKFRDQVLTPLIEAGLVEMTIPDKPSSPKQQYRITGAGRAAIAQHKSTSALGVT